MAKHTKQWYASWFNTPYYHTLYKDRNDNEAKLFMDNLTQHLQLPKQASILDLACGKGRHSLYLNSLGYKVTGLDLSDQSIAYAKQFENQNLKFEVHNMTLPYPKTFDAVFNLFTSFGYFENNNDNLKTITTIKTSLKKNGVGVIDFLNANYVINHLVKDEIKSVDGIDFYLKRKVENGFITKTITFEAEGTTHQYQERVRALTLKDFEAFFKTAKVSLIQTFGNYNLEAFCPEKSKRLILVFK